METSVTCDLIGRIVLLPIKRLLFCFVSPSSFSGATICNCKVKNGSRNSAIPFWITGCLSTRAQTTRGQLSRHDPFSSSKANLHFLLSFLLSGWINRRNSEEWFHIQTCRRSVGSKETTLFCHRRWTETTGWFLSSMKVLKGRNTSRMPMRAFWSFFGTFSWKKKKTIPWTIVPNASHRWSTKRIFGHTWPAEQRNSLKCGYHC